jgi:predicted  nucleic acid-binding Zn-ribbon protein
MFHDGGPLREDSSEYLKRRELVHKGRPAVSGDSLICERDNLQKKITRCKQDIASSSEKLHNGELTIQDLEKRIEKIQAVVQKIEEDKQALAEDVVRTQAEHKKTQERVQQLESSFFRIFRFRERAVLREEYEAQERKESAQREEISALLRKTGKSQDEQRRLETALKAEKRSARSAKSLYEHSDKDLVLAEGELTDLLKGESDAYTHTFSSFVHGLGRHKVREAFVPVLEKAKQDALLQDQLFSHFGKKRSDESEVEQLHRELRDTQQSPEAFFKLLEIYREHFRELSKEFDKEKEHIAENFLQLVDGAIVEGWLPVDRERVLRRLKETRIHLDDPMTAVAEGHSDLWEISISTPKKDWRHTMVHELVHQTVAGRELHAGYYEGGALLLPLFIRSGLRKMEYDKLGNGVSTRYENANEAVTEKITQRLLNDPEEERGDYAIERYQLDKILKNDPGLEPAMLAAYCEDEDPELPEAEQNPRWNDFVALRNWDREVRGLF